MTLEGRAIRHVRIPADIEREDHIAFNLTARQLAVLALAGLTAGFIVTIARRALPLPLALAFAGPVAVAGLVLALARVHGLPGDRFALAVLEYLRTPRRQVPAPGGVAPPPPWATEGVDLPAPLTLPVKDLHSNGIIDLGADGASLVCRASAINFRLRTEEEQEAVITAFGRFLHSVSGAVQIIVRSERADLRTAVAQLRQLAGGLPHPALEGAAIQHAQFLESLTARRDVLRRELLVVFREPATNNDPAAVLPRRAEQAAALLAGAGISLTALDYDAAADVLARTANPGGPPRPAGLAAPGETITRRPS